MWNGAFGEILFNIILIIGRILSFAQNHYCVQSPDGETHLLTIDISHGMQIDSIGVQFTSTGNGVDGFNGMAKDPTTGEIYVSVKDDNSDRRLGILDPTTGNITSLGVLTINNSSISFDATGTLYAMNGAGSTSLYTLNKTTGAATLFHDWTSPGDDGEVICVNTTDGLMYRYDGGPDGNLMTLNLTTMAEATIDSCTGLDTWGGGVLQRIYKRFHFGDGGNIL